MPNKESTEREFKDFSVKRWVAFWEEIETHLEMIGVLADLIKVTGNSSEEQ